MRLLLLVALLAGCTGNVDPFTITLSNPHDHTIWLGVHPTEDVPWIVLDQRVGDRGVYLAPDPDELCAALCSENDPGVYDPACPTTGHFAPMGEGFALPGGTSVVREFDGELWSLDSMEKCIRPGRQSVSHRLVVCFGRDVLDPDTRDPIDAPEGAGRHPVWVDYLDCLTPDSDLQDQRVVF